MTLPRIHTGALTWLLLVILKPAYASDNLEGLVQYTVACIPPLSWRLWFSKSVMESSPAYFQQAAWAILNHSQVQKALVWGTPTLVQRVFESVKLCSSATVEPCTATWIPVTFFPFCSLIAPLETLLILCLCLFDLHPLFTNESP